MMNVILYMFVRVGWGRDGGGWDGGGGGGACVRVRVFVTVRMYAGWEGYFIPLNVICCFSHVHFLNVWK